MDWEAHGTAPAGLLYFCAWKTAPFVSNGAVFTAIHKLIKPTGI